MIFLPVFYLFLYVFIINIYNKENNILKKYYKKKTYKK